jgi:hypothetical protein
MHHCGMDRALPCQDDRSRRVGLGRRIAFRIRVLRADLANFFLLQYRGCDGFLITGKNSGTHWLKFMLSCAIAHQYGVPPPEHASGRDADAIIGHPRWPQVYAQLPRIGSSHSIPSIVFAWRLRLFAHPPVVVFVRDIRQAMLSNYVKWRERYDVPFTEYLKGDPLGRRFVADIWWYIHFFNRWGAVAQAWPETTLIVHYEDVQAAPGYWLRRIAQHLGVALDDAAVAAALPFVERTAVQAQLDPGYGETIIPEPDARARAAFSPEQAALCQAILQRHLRFTLGYDYRLPPARSAAGPPPSWAPARLAR